MPRNLHLRDPTNVDLLLGYPKPCHLFLRHMKESTIFCIPDDDCLNAIIAPCGFDGSESDTTTSSGFFSRHSLGSDDGPGNTLLVPFSSSSSSGALPFPDFLPFFPAPLSPDFTLPFPDRKGVLERSPLPSCSVDPKIDLPSGVSLHSRGFRSLSESRCGTMVATDLILLPTHLPC